MTELHEAIINDTGIGNIKDYTPKYKFIIPYFDIATWHDYMEENFRSIDALFNYIYEIKQYRGKWKQLTKVNVNDVYFIDDDEDPLNGRLVKVLVEHTTDDTAHFSDYYNAHQSYYEIFDDASAAQVYAQEAKEARNDTIGYKNTAQTAASNANNSANSAQQYTTNALQHATNSYNSSLSSQQSADNALTYSNNASQSADDAQISLNKINMKPLIVTNKNVEISSWVEYDDSQYSDTMKSTYPYKAVINIPADKLVDKYGQSTALVTFKVDDVLTGNYAPVCNCDPVYTSTDGKLKIQNFNVTIFSKVNPLAKLMIDSIIIYFEESE